MKRILAGVMIFIVGVICGLIFTYGSIHAQGSINENDIMSKLNEISGSQAETAAALNSIKEDIRMIKLRITQMQ